jgi:hypothetical protein
MKAHAIVESLPAEFFEIGHGGRSRVIVKTDHHLLEISLLADFDLHNRDLWTHGCGKTAGEGCETSNEGCKKSFHQETSGN